MTQEEKLEKAKVNMDYKERLEKAKELYPTANAEQRYVLECLFPELKECQDEEILEIIKHCIESRYLHTSTIKGISQKECFAWLEKQETSYTKKDVDEAFVEGMALAKNEFEKQGEQKPAEKVEPKFKVGDKIIKFSKTPCPVHSSTDDTICKVAEVHDTCYILNTKEGRIQVPFEWQDHYELVGQKSAWSEEDENGLGDALWCCKQAASIAKDENDMGNVWYAEHWLKSLKDRVKSQNTWKPSDAQIRALEYIINNAHNTPYSCKIAKELLEQLRKLKGE